MMFSSKKQYDHGKIGPLKVDSDRELQVSNKNGHMKLLRTTPIIVEKVANTTTWMSPSPLWCEKKLFCENAIGWCGFSKPFMVGC
jgi:hypothetical protein